MLLFLPVRITVETKAEMSGIDFLDVSNYLSIEWPSGPELLTRTIPTPVDLPLKRSKPFILGVRGSCLLLKTNYVRRTCDPIC